MSDFYLDLRTGDQRRSRLAADRLKHFPDMRVIVFEEPQFSLVLTRCDDLDLWGPYSSPDKSLTVALAGRIALDAGVWDFARRIAGPGGLACKAISELYQQHGAAALQNLNGNFTIIIHDKSASQVLIATDRCGAAPAFQASDPVSFPVFSSHPDLLAVVINAGDDLDLVSMAEFLSTGKVSFPYTYYQTVSSLEYATITTITLGDGNTPSVVKNQYYSFDHRPDVSASNADHIEKLATSFQASIRRRTLPLLGKPVVSLSGGLDSRTILRACPEGAEVITICFFDQENAEVDIARRIATAGGAAFVPLERKFDHYGDSAVDGVRISGGMASLASNHYLGFRERIRELGAGSLLTGCYCDYLFKGLALNRKVHPLLRTETLRPFGHDWYRPFYSLTSPLMHSVENRWEEVYPSALRDTRDESSLFQLEARRIFPLAYEPDHTQRLIPQRVMPWYVPIVDNDIIDVYSRIPMSSKLNAALFARMVELVCGRAVSAIPDSNTWAPVNASRSRVLFELYRRALLSKLRDKLKPSIANNGSWPNWSYYVSHSEVIQRLWSQQGNTARPILAELLGFDPFAKPLDYWLGGKLELFLRLLTLKIWLDVRIRS